MPEYLHPGVYVEETSYRGKPIQGVSTSTGGFVGAARKGPEGKPYFVGSLNQFRRDFGDPISPTSGLGDYLGHSVKAFFDNGGARCYVVRVLPGDATAAAATLDQGIVLRLATGATVRGASRRITLNSLRRVVPGSLLHVFTRTSSTEDFAETRTVTVESCEAVRNRITVIAADEIPIGVTLDPDHTYFLVDGVRPHGGTAAGPVFQARNRGVDGDRISVQVRPTDLPPVAFRTSSAARSTPELDVLVGPIADGAVDIELTTAALRRLRTGDSIAVGTAQQRIVSAIDPAEVDFAVVAGGSAADYSAGGGTISLLSRAGNALAAPLPLGAIPAGAFNMTAAPVTEANFPHDAAATVQVGDRIRLEDGGNIDDIDVTAIRFSEQVAAGTHVHLDPATPVTPAQAGPNISVRLVRTSNTNPDLTRLVVSDASGFTAPFRAGSAEAIAITNGGAYEAATIELVDPATSSLIVRKANPATAGQFSTAVTEDNWVSIESTQIAEDGQTTVTLASTGSFYSGATVEVDTGTQKIECVVASVDSGARTITFTAGLPLGAGNFIDAAANPATRNTYVRTAEIEIQILEDGEVKETFSGLSWNSDTAADSFLRNFVERINDAETGSKLVQITLPIPGGTALVNQPTTRDGQALSLGGGGNGTALTEVDLIGTDNGPGLRTGIEALADRDDISIVAVPGVSNESVQSALISHCERLKYRMAVLDGPMGNRLVTDIQAHRNNYDTKYAAYYAPWLKTMDLTTGRSIFVPPSGHAMGIYARTDSQVGVHKAPANEVVRNITEVEFPFGNAEQDVLNPVGVNLIRDLTPNGIRVWGARIITSDQEWKYVNVRRLFIFLEHSIDKGTQWVVFEPNNESLWARVVETITSFLTGVWKTGALMGTTPDEAFFVRCDETTMTQDDLDNGRLICEIGVAPTFPAEFVIFRIGQFTATAS